MMRKSTHHAADGFFLSAKQWPAEMEKLRKILLECKLTETIKWSKPCYTHEGKNIVLIQPFKDYCALLFFKGYLMKDPAGILIKTGEHTVVGRQLRFTSVKQVTDIAATLKEYIKEAIEVERSGITVEAEKPAPLELAAEFQEKLDKTPALKKAFNALTPGRQRAYNIYISQAKQSATRASRVEKCIPQILAGKGLND